jgi:hypothetical protein
MRITDANETSLVKLLRFLRCLSSAVIFANATGDFRLSNRSRFPGMHYVPPPRRAPPP